MVFSELHSSEYGQGSKLHEARGLLDAAIEENGELLSPSRKEVIAKVNRMRQETQG